MSLYRNYAEIAGRLGCNPEIRYFQDGTPTCDFRVAVKETWKNSDGTKQEKTTWVNVKFNGSIVPSFIEKYIANGDNVFITGKWQSREWEDNDGNKRKFVYILGDKIDLIEQSSKNNAAKTPPDPNDKAAAMAEECPY